MLNLTKTTIIVMFLVPLLVLLVKPLTLSTRFIQAATKAAVIVILMTVIVLVSLLRRMVLIMVLLIMMFIFLVMVSLIG